MFKGVDLFVEQRKGIVVAATNYEDQLDGRLKDRFRKKIRVGPPDTRTRKLKIEEILTQATEEFDVTVDQTSLAMEIAYLVQATKGCSIRQIERILFNSLKLIVLEEKERVTLDMLCAEVTSEKIIAIGSALEKLHERFPHAVPLQMVNTDDFSAHIAVLMSNCSFAGTEYFMHLLQEHISKFPSIELSMEKVIDITVEIDITAYPARNLKKLKYS